MDIGMKRKSLVQSGPGSIAPNSTDGDGVGLGSLLKTNLNQHHPAVDTKSELIDRYKYTVPSSDMPDPVQDDQSPGPRLTLLDISTMCEYRVLARLFLPASIEAKKIIELEKLFISAKLNAIAISITKSNSKQPKPPNISIPGIFHDDIRYYKNEVPLLTEEIQNCSGFLREYFSINDIIVIMKSGTIISAESEYCWYWTKDRLNTIKGFLDTNGAGLDLIELSKRLSTTEECMVCKNKASCELQRFHV